MLLHTSSTEREMQLLSGVATFLKRRSSRDTTTSTSAMALFGSSAQSDATKDDYKMMVDGEHSGKRECRDDKSVMQLWRTKKKELNIKRLKP